MLANLKKCQSYVWAKGRGNDIIDLTYDEQKNKKLRRRMYIGLLTTPTTPSEGHDTNNKMLLMCYTTLCYVWSLKYKIKRRELGLVNRVSTTSQDVIMKGVASPLYITQQLRFPYHNVFLCLGPCGFVFVPTMTNFSIILPLTY